MEDKKPRKIAYEWVLQMSKGEDILLTENQYEFYKKNYKEAKVFFADVEINPAFVMNAVKRPATNWLKDKYPCRECYTAGRNKDNTDWCEVCGGSGVKLP